MQRNTNMVAVDGHKIRMCIIKHGDDQKSAATKMGLAPSTLSKRLKDGVLSRTELFMIAHLYGVEEKELLPDAPEVVEKRESDWKTKQSLEALTEKLDYINRNICELVDVANKILELLQ